MIELYDSRRGSGSPVPVSNALFQALGEKQFVIFAMQFAGDAEGCSVSIVVAKEFNLDYTEQVDLDHDELVAVLQEHAEKRGHAGHVCIYFDGGVFYVLPGDPWVLSTAGSSGAPKDGANPVATVNSPAAAQGGLPIKVH